MKVLDAILDLMLTILAAFLAICAVPLGMASGALLMLAMITNSMTSHANESKADA